MALSFAQLDAAADKLQALFDKSGTKDNDVVGGNYIFTIKDLLKNDTNAKADTFFFGDGLDALKQDEYMKAHGIIDNHNGTYTATAGMDFGYSVWTGKGLIGSFSKADVDVLDKAAPAAPAVADKDKDKPPVDNGNNAAKDDKVGVDHFTFTKADLLANDPGGADKDHNMFFGDTAADQGNQAAYLAAHGITDVNNDGVYEIGANATDFDYWVQMGNNGTWSKAHVDVVNTPAPPPPPVVAHDGACLLSEDFDEVATQTYTTNGQVASASIDLTLTGWTGTGHNDQFGFTTTSEVGRSGILGGIVATSGHQFLDTQNTPGGIDISHTFVDSTAAIGNKTATLSFDIGKMSVNWDGTNFDTKADAWIQFKIDGTIVKEFHASDFATPNQLQHFDIDISNYTGGGTTHTFELVDKSPTDGYFGFAVDSIKIKDWTTGNETDCGCHTPVAHNGGLVANWDFENHKQAQGDEVGTPTGFWNLDNWYANNSQYYPEADAGGFAGGMQVHGEDGHRALDTAASPGNIFLQAIPAGRGGDAATMPDLVAGKEYHAEVMIAKQHFDDPTLIAEGHEGTDPDAWVQFNFNDKVLKVHASDIHVENEFVKFDINFTGVEGEDGFSIMSHGTNDDAQGLLIDSIQIHDWII